MNDVSSVDSSVVHRLGFVDGFNGKRNEVLFCGTPNPEHNVVFFGGDVQEYPEVMLAHRDNKNYIQWNLENTCRLLADKFPRSHVFIIKPSSMHLKTFSSYMNFVESDIMGCPMHSEGQQSWQSLSALLENSVAKVHPEFSPSLEVPLDIIGFSKGCVVLNQLVYDMKADDELTKKVRGLYWLDGGHNGGSKTWITDLKLLEVLASTCINVFCHVTPYQLGDSNRKWIAKEQKKFVSVLRRLSAKVSNTVHFEGEERNLDLHFKVLTEFV
ncbi:hypothetical protein CAPTEDRAFT_122025 [Capitella teleta]|uniref:Uncharacterized protein n=1 Tax=Capitella teleta TaxID=283909 RepID=R7V1W8_CAPTE|nr:hypothetical protein CAPTEDRAFT_122025 [Capitella teleta]|eukprot:ELU10321.1 hypothetical protein CAPTEDRAFT_122025 [Capitella teleta]